jgi:hypothetical protein
MFAFFDIYIFIQVSGCVGMGRAVLTALYSPGQSSALGPLPVPDLGQMRPCAIVKL